MRPRLPFTWVDAVLWVLAAVFVFTAFPAAVSLNHGLNYLERSGAVDHMKRLGLIEP